MGQTGDRGPRGQDLVLRGHEELLIYCGNWPSDDQSAGLSRTQGRDLRKKACLAFSLGLHDRPNRGPAARAQDVRGGDALSLQHGCEAEGDCPLLCFFPCPNPILSVPHMASRVRTADACAGVREKWWAACKEEGQGRQVLGMQASVAGLGSAMRDTLNPTHTPEVSRVKYVAIWQSTESLLRPRPAGL